MKTDFLSLSSLREAYASGEWTPRSLISAIHEEIEASGDTATFIRLLSSQEWDPYVNALEGKDPSELPLYGVPFAIKDNIDLAGIPTTAGCPEYGFVPDDSAFVVAQLVEAGAIPIGKTNLDQFATGLVGVRTPYDVPSNVFNSDYIPGGSSSGSAVAMAKGWCTFSLGTDTAGSGRVPAAFHELIGVKPTRGRLSCGGVVPACRSLDCVSIFAHNATDADSILEVASAFDAEDAYARPVSEEGAIGRSFQFGVPREEDLEFFGDANAEQLFRGSISRLEAIGGVRVEIDFSPFLQAARLLYEGPWVSERYVAIHEFLTTQPDAVFPVTRKIIEGGAELLAPDLFRAQYRLADLKRKADEVWGSVDLVLTPTVGTAYKIEEVNADPVQLNSNLGYYTNFMNLLDYSAIAFPSGRLDVGVPWGATLFAPAFSDKALLGVVQRLEGCEPAVSADRIEIAVCGAHMEGLPLNFQLTERGGVFEREAKTSGDYQLFALPATDVLPPRPGLIRTGEEASTSIGLEIWSLDKAGFGDFVAQIPSPLGIGKLQLDDGMMVSGFLCETIDTLDADEISHFGGWRGYLASC